MLAAILAYRLERALYENWELTPAIGYWLNEIRELNLGEMFEPCPAEKKTC
jgi:hypothetical protein